MLVVETKPLRNRALPFGKLENTERSQNYKEPPPREEKEEEENKSIFSGVNDRL